MVFTIIHSREKYFTGNIVSKTMKKLRAAIMSRVVAVPRVSERMHRRCECIVIVDVQRYTCAMLRKHYVNNNKRALCVCVCADLRNNVSTPTVAADRREMNRVTHTSLGLPDAL